MNKILPLLIPMLLIVVAGVIIAIGRGYRVDTIKGTFAPTGILLATADPDAAQVLVDGKFSGATNSNITLKPNWYEVTIRKEGYQEWVKKMRIQGEVVSKTDSTLFLTNPSLSPLTSVNVANPMLSPDGTKIAYMATPSMELKNDSELSLKLAAIPVLYLLDLTSRMLPFDKNPKPYEGTLNQLFSEWEADEKLLHEIAMRKLPPAFLAIATSSSRIISFSPDDTKVLYEATASATLSRVINPAFNGTSPTEDVRNLKTDTLYVYDVKEDRNYELNNFQFSPMFQSESDQERRTIFNFPMAPSLPFLRIKKYSKKVSASVLMRSSAWCANARIWCPDCISTCLTSEVIRKNTFIFKAASAHWWKNLIKIKFPSMT